MQREDERLKIYKKGKSPPLIYFYTDIECVTVNEHWISPIPEKTR